MPQNLANLMVFGEAKLRLLLSNSEVSQILSLSNGLGRCVFGGRPCGTIIYDVDDEHTIRLLLAQ